jgi:acetylornithine deacetylase
MIDLIEQKARAYDLSIEWELRDPFAISPEAEIIQAAVQAAGISQAETVPFGTEAAVYKDYLQLVILGPGNIDQAHTVGEWIDLAQLQQSVEVYRRMIETFCMS